MVSIETELDALYRTLPRDGGIFQSARIIVADLQNPYCQVDAVLQQKFITQVKKLVLNSADLTLRAELKAIIGEIAYNEAMAMINFN